MLRQAFVRTCRPLYRLVLQAMRSGSKLVTLYAGLTKRFSITRMKLMLFRYVIGRPSRRNGIAKYLLSRSKKHLEHNAAASNGRFFSWTFFEASVQLSLSWLIWGNTMTGYRFVEINTTDVGARGSVQLLADIFSAQCVRAYGTTITFCLPEKYWSRFHEQLCNVGSVQSVWTSSPRVGESIIAAKVPLRYQAN